MVIQNSLFQIIFNILGTLLYNANIEDNDGDTIIGKIVHLLWR